MRKGTKVKYVCMRCGNCCRWEGYVRLTSEDIDRIAEYLGVSREAFVREYTRMTSDRRGLSLTEKPNGDCIFLEGNTCIVHAVKPKQCTGFPNSWRFSGFRRDCSAKRIVLDAEEA